MNPPDLRPLAGCRVLVTGATGFVGANLVRRLLAEGAQVHALARPGASRWRLAGVAGPLLWHTGDLEQPQSLARPFAEARPELIFHVAVPRGGGREARAAILRGNLLGAHALIELAAGQPLRRLVVVGSALEYGPVAGPMSETLPLAPTTWHGATKAAATLLFQQAARAEGLPLALLRLFHVYGPWESSHRLLPTALRAALTGAPLPLTAPGIRRDYVYVEDVVEALLRAAQADLAPGELFNIGSGVEHANEALVACVEQVTGLAARRLPGTFPARITDSDHRLADPRRAAERLGWRPRHDLRAGVAATLAWYRAHPEAWSRPDDTPPLTQ